MNKIITDYPLLLRAIQAPKIRGRGISNKEVSKITEIRGSNSGGLHIVTPFNSTILSGEGAFPFYIVADANQLYLLLKKLPKLTKIIELEILDNSSVLTFRVNNLKIDYKPLKIESF